MLKLKNTISCPGCGAILRVSAIVVSDGKEYHYYLCPACAGMARQDPATGEWALHGAGAGEIPGIVKNLQRLAMEDWSARATARSPVVTSRLPPSVPEKDRPTARVQVFRAGGGTQGTP